MKDHGILHPRLAEVVASMGHGDLLAIVDAGLPVPVEAERIDLGFAPGKPGFLDVVDTVLGELKVEAYILSTESREACPRYVGALREALPEAEAVWVEHEELKRLSGGARAIVRTGEFTPYANVILRSGVAF